MDWNEPAAAVMSRGTAAVLRVLAGADGSFCVRELARLAGAPIDWLRSPLPDAGYRLTRSMMRTSAPSWNTRVNVPSSGC